MMFLSTVGARFVMSASKERIELQGSPANGKMGYRITVGGAGVRDSSLGILLPTKLGASSQAYRLEIME